MYYKGDGVQVEKAEAARWYQQAAEQGHARAQFNLGYMYVLGEGVLEDFVQAYAWVTMSAAQGNEQSKQGKKLLEKEMTRAQIDEAQKLSHEYWEAYGPRRGNK